MPGFEYRRPGGFGAFRFLIGVWLVVLTALLYGWDRAGWWMPLLLVAAALHFYLAYRLRKLIP